jgi:replicative DNA helicase
MTERESRPAEDSALRHVPPHSREAEESLLSAMLNDPESLQDVAGSLKPEDFYRMAHQRICAAIFDLVERTEPVDLVTVSNLLRERKQLEEIGGAAYLARLASDVPLAVNALSYARIIYEKACLRRLIATAQQVARRCYEESGNAEEILDYAEATILEVSTQKARPPFHPLSKIIEHSFSVIEERGKNKQWVTGVPSGFSKLDRMTSGLQRSDLVILAARPSMGKTALALNIARNAAVEAGVPVAVFSLEMSKEQLSMRMLCAEAGVDWSSIRSGFLQLDDWDRLHHGAGVLHEAPIFIDDTPALSVMEIRGKARRLFKDKAIGLIVIDYIQLMRSRETMERRDLEISDISRSLKSLAKELNIPILALSQLNRKLEERSDKRPQLSDLRESGALEQDADIVLFIYRDEVYNRDENNPNRGKAELLLAKHRNGPTGMVPLTFLHAYTRFENLASETMAAMVH